VRVSIRVIRNLDNSTVHERVVEVGEDMRIGGYVDELIGNVWPDAAQATQEYKLTVEVADSSGGVAHQSLLARHVE
jgi:hypothetical protein